MVLYGITLVSLVKEVRGGDPGLLFPFYVEDVAFNGSTRGSAQILKLLMKRGQTKDISPSQRSPSSS